MSHFKQYQGDLTGSEDRNLGDEWLDWDGIDQKPIKEGKTTFIATCALFILITCACVTAFTYLITPRLELWNPTLPLYAWFAAFSLIALTLFWYTHLVVTALSGKKIFYSPLWIKPLYDLAFAGAFKLACTIGIPRDRIGHSFIKISNSISKAVKPKGRKENLLILLPRCLKKEQLQKINSLKDIYPLTVHTVSGGELARKKVKEVKPTAVIGVACERDLVSGIRDVGSSFSVIGITNQRPEGPCKNTNIDMDALIRSIEFFVGPPKITA